MIQINDCSSLYQSAARAMVTAGQDVRFLVIGAMDGVNHDPLHVLIAENPSWQGLLVEPLPDMFAKLQETYSGRDNLKFACCAISDSDGEATMHRIPADYVGKECPAWADGISTLHYDKHLMSQQAELSSRAVTETVSVRTLSSVLSENDMEEFDIVQIDTEGHDAVVFDQMWKAGLRPSILLVERVYMTAAELDKITTTLSIAGYNIFADAQDLLALK